jgi:hypothetical protein
MDSIVREDIQRLAAAEGGPHVSLYMPTHRAVKYNGQDPLQFRNMLKRAAVRRRQTATPLRGHRGVLG